MEHWPYWFRERRSGANGLIRGKRLLSKVDTLHLVEGAGGGSSASLRGGSTSTSQTVTIQQRDVIDGQLFRNLSPDQALALLSLKGYAADDVLNVVPVFV